METLVYMLKVNLYGILFYICYWVLLRKHTFFQLNRLYLVITLFLSLTIPLIEFTETVRLIPVASEGIAEPTHYLASTAVMRSTDWIPVLSVMYVIGVAYMLITLLAGFYRLYHVLKQGDRIKLEGYTLVLLPETRPASKSIGSFSFFNFMVVSNRDYENHFDTILLHETVHIRQRHSLDIVLIEAFKIIFWFNPAFWFYKYSLREVHEFLADQAAESKDLYAKFLVSYAQSGSFESVTSNFFSSSLLKNRVRMIYRKTSSSWLLCKYIIIIPVIAFTTLKTAARNQIIMEVKSDTHTTALNQDRKSDSANQLSKDKKRAALKTYKKSSSRKSGTHMPGSNLKERYMNYNISQQYKQSKSADHTDLRFFNYNKIQKREQADLSFSALHTFENPFGSSLDLSKANPPETTMPSLGISINRSVVPFSEHK